MHTLGPAPTGDPDPVLVWLLDGDPSIRWQVLRDLAHAPQPTVDRERRKIAREGWGARLLAEQDDAGMWARGQSRSYELYLPKWTSTTYTMLLLRDLGLPPSNRRAHAACRLLLDGGLHRDGGINYGWRGPSETCVTGMVASILSYFKYDDHRLDDVAAHLLAEQMPDGGWNCRRHRGATHASVNTTISVLEGLRSYELHRGSGDSEIQAAQCRGREFLLAHRLFRSHRTGAVMRPEFLLFAFPPRWHYDILRALDYFQSVRAPRDPRLSEAIEVVRAKGCEDGRWKLQHCYRAKTYFELEKVGAPSRWNTLRALRVLNWWHRGT